MKHSLILLFALLLSAPSFAQLQAPTTHVKDTIFVIGVEYNKYLLSMEDYPCRFIEESATSFYAAGQEYKKGRKPIESIESSGEGEITTIEYPHASVNNKPAAVTRIEADEKCENPSIIMLILDDYTFIGWSVGTIRDIVNYMPEDMQPFMNKFIKVWLNGLPYDELESCITEEELQMMETYKKMLFNQ